MSDETLPQRTTEELIHALRVRAGLLSGATWEAPATANMMREAAARLAALDAELQQARTEIERLQKGTP